MSIEKASLDRDLFKSNPNLYIENVIKEYLAHSPINQLVEFDNDPVWGEPIVAFADGDDPLFQTLKKTIGDFHMTPREALEKYTHEYKGWFLGLKKEYPVSVISYVLPIPQASRDVERNSPFGGTRRFNQNRWLGETVWRNLEHYVASLLEMMGHHAFAPGRSIYFRDVTNLLDGRWRPTWNERSVAHISGLGTYGLNGLIITEKGCSAFLESIVCDVALKPTPRPYDDLHAYCPYFKDKSCGKCIDRCLSGAITEKGRDILICRQYLGRDQVRKMKQAGMSIEGYIGKAPTCGLCSTGVPCEGGIPHGFEPKKSVQE
jgi:hypothetical protein